MVIRNVVAWNTIIVGCENCGEGNDVMKLLREMLREGFFPDELTISSIISSWGYASAITETMEAHVFVVKSSFQEFSSVANSLISAYSKCGSITSACKCFRLTREPDLVTWTSLINAYAFHGLAKEAIEVFGKMLSCGVIPDRISFLGVLSACSHCGLVTHGLCLFVFGHSDFSFRRSCSKKVIYEKNIHQASLCLCHLFYEFFVWFVAGSATWMDIFVSSLWHVFVCLWSSGFSIYITRLCRKQFRQSKLSWSLYQIRTTIFLLA